MASAPSLYPAAPPHRVRNLALLFGANIVSGFAQGITIIGIPWYLTSILGRPDLNQYIVGGSQMVIVFWGLYAGTLVDRLSRKRMFLAINLAGALLLGGIATTGYLLADVPLPLVALAMLGTYMIFTVHYPNMYAFIQELFEPRMYGRLNSAIEVQGQLVNALGMAVGGILLEGTQNWTMLSPEWRFPAWTLYEVFAINACTYVVAFGILSQIRYTPTPREDAHLPLMERLRTGLRFLVFNKALLVFGLGSYALFFCVMIFYPVLAPTYIDKVLHLGGDYLGFAESSHAVGAFLAGVVGLGLQQLVGRANTVTTILVFSLLGALIFGVLAGLPAGWSLLGGAAVIGFINSGTRILRVTYLLKVVPNRVIGRVNSTLSITNGLARSLFILALPNAFGWLSPGDQSLLALWTLAGINLLAFGIMLFFRKKLQRDTPFEMPKS
jgi:MFS family permease